MPRRDGTGKPVSYPAPRARGCDLDPVCELPYGPAAHGRPHHRPNRCQHPATRDTNSKISLALTEAFSNRVLLVKSLLIASIAVPGSRFSPRSEGSAATSGSK